MSRRKKVTRGNPAARVTVYHYTHQSHMPSILRAGELRITESNVSFEKAHAGPDVLWLSTDPDLIGSTASGLGLFGGGGESKAQVRFTLSLPKAEVHVWRDWARQHGSNERAISTLAAAGGSDAWRVIERPVAQSEWVSIDGARDDAGR